MRYLSIIIMLALPFVSAAQASFTADDYFTAGDQIVYREYNHTAAPVPIQQITADNWNFDLGNDFTLNTVTAAPVSQLTATHNFPATAFTVEQMGLHIAQNIVDNQLYILGVVADLLGRSLVLELPQSYAVLRFPLAVGDKESISHNTPITTTLAALGLSGAALGLPLEPDSVRINLNIQTDYEITGQGLLLGNLPAFREERSIQLRASVEALIVFLGQTAWIPVPDMEREVTASSVNYWSAEYGAPALVLQLNSTGQVTKVLRADNLVVDIDPAESLASANQLEAWPNPANGRTRIRGARGTVTLYDLAGRLAARADADGTMDLQGLASGLYIARDDRNSLIITIR